MSKRQSGQKKRRGGSIPTDSFSDIAFLLIIYFMVATTLVKVKTIVADLPSGEKSAQSQSDKTPIINLRGNEVFLNDKPVSIDELDDRLAALELGKAAPEKRVIMLESTAGTPYEKYFRALSSISANGGVVALVEEEK